MKITPVRVKYYTKLKNLINSNTLNTQLALLSLKNIYWVAALVTDPPNANSTTDTDTQLLSDTMSTNLALEDHVGNRSGRPEDNGPHEEDYSDWVAWRKGKVGLPGLYFLSPHSLSPRQSSPPPVAHYLQGALA